VGQTATLVPADRILYGIRDITSTVDSIPLIAASIVSKKLAEGLKALVLDVKVSSFLLLCLNVFFILTSRLQQVGRAAFMQTHEKARELAVTMQAAGQATGVNTTALLTPMDHPIGRMIGNALEVLESVHCLQGRGPADLEELVCVQGGHLLLLVGKAASAEAGAAMVRATLHDGTALAKFEAMVAVQANNAEVARQLCSQPESILEAAPHTTDILSPVAGFVSDMDAYQLAVYASSLGAGRRVRTDVVDFAVGLQVLVPVGEPIAAGQAWLRVHHRQAQLASGDAATLNTLLTVSAAPPPAAPTILEVISA
jgi:thymidine phosphorylase